MGHSHQREPRARLSLVEGMSVMTWTRPMVRRKLLELLTKHSAAPVSESTHLVVDLGIDSLGVMEIVAAIEDTFNLSIPDAALRDVETVADVATAIEKGLAGEGRLDG